MISLDNWLYRNVPGGLISHLLINCLINWNLLSNCHVHGSAICSVSIWKSRGLGSVHLEVLTILYFGVNFFYIICFLNISREYFSALFESLMNVSILIPAIVLWYLGKFPRIQHSWGFSKRSQIFLHLVLVHGLSGENAPLNVNALLWATGEACSEELHFGVSI